MSFKKMKTKIHKITTNNNSQIITEICGVAKSGKTTVLIKDHLKANAMLVSNEMTLDYMVKRARELRPDIPHHNNSITFISVVSGKEINDLKKISKMPSPSIILLDGTGWDQQKISEIQKLFPKTKEIVSTKLTSRNPNNPFVNTK